VALGFGLVDGFGMGWRMNPTDSMESGFGESGSTALGEWLRQISVVGGTGK